MMNIGFKIAAEIVNLLVAVLFLVLFVKRLLKLRSLA